MGTCTPLNECSNVKPEGTSKIRRPDICNHHGPMPVVCCVPKKQPSAEENVQALSLSSPIRDWTSGSKPIWLQKCMEYAKFLHENDKGNPELEFKTAQCPQSNKKKAGRAEFGEFPHMAAIGYELGHTIQFQCGGSLISERYVLTAAHCVYGGPSRPRWTLLGELSLDETIMKYEQLFNTSQKIEIPGLIRISQLIPYQDYTQDTHRFDVGLLQLAHSPRLGPYLRPACLSSGRLTSGLELVLTGWGSKGDGGETNYDLLKVTLLEAPFDECQNSYAKYNRGNNPLRLHAGSMLCAGRPNSKADSCRGDSGGPLQANYPDLYCMHEIVGIVSFGSKDCGTGVPGVYSRVEYFRSWIEDIVWN